MDFLINELKLEGAKNISKPIELVFTNKTLDRVSFSTPYAKAIYGPNGSGKSAIVSAMYIYKKLLMGSSGLNDRYFASFVSEIINKDSNILNIEVIFTANNVLSNSLNCYKHSITLSNKDGEVLIKKEQIFSLKGKTIADNNFKLLLSVENGLLKMIDGIKEEDLSSNPLYLNSLNLLSTHSITEAFFKTCESIEQKDIANEPVLMGLFRILLFAMNLIVELNKEDTHNDYIKNKVLSILLENDEKANEIIKKNSELTSKEYIFKLSIKDADVVLEKDYPSYLRTIKKLTDFIRIFKPSLDEIVIDKKINDEKLYCKKIFRYGKKMVDIEFESTGIKKLVGIYSALRAAANGSIVFIDEMDANLHDVYFGKLIEFFAKDSKGQLCFTTHNLEPINVLKGMSHSLDFLSNDSTLYSWKKNGNESPINKYVNGLIPYSPFNVESFDFDLLLGDDDI